MRLHVPGALPGERVAAIVEHRSPHRPEAWARLDQVLQPSPERVAPVCPAYGPCGGCPLQHLAYPAQVAWKRERVVAALAVHPSLGGVPVAACVPSPRPLGYRNQAKYVYGRTEARRLVLGAYVPRSHAILDMAGCQVVEPPLDEVAAVAREVLAARAVAPYDERTHAGLLRYVLLRASAAGDVLVTLVTARDEWPEARALAEELRAQAPRVLGVVQNVNPTIGNVLLGPTEIVLAGQASYEDAIGPVRVELTSRSFFQVNRDVAAEAYARVRSAAENLGAIDRAIDLYAGAGGIAFALAPTTREVLAIEENAAATRAASAFAARQGLAHVRFATGDASELLMSASSADLVVLNPPRSGCAPAVLAAVRRMRPRLVAYLSCDPQTLARDLDSLGRDLTVTDVTPLDMLPHTPHVEALALLVSSGSTP